MAGTQKVRGKVNVLLNGLIREGIISGFKTNFGHDNETEAPQVTVTAPEGRSLEEVRAIVLDALTETAIGIDVTVERS